MYNLNDEIDLTQQILKYKSSELILTNRNFISSEENPMGYSKEIGNYTDIIRVDFNNVYSQESQRPFFKLSWDLFISLDQYLLLMEIINNYRDDIRNTLGDSSNLYSPGIYQLDSLLLEDRRIRDIYTGTYKTYEINITSVDNVTEIFFNLSLIKLSMSGETL